MGGRIYRRNKSGNIRSSLLALAAMEAKDLPMAMDAKKIDDGPNARPLDETIAGTGPGIADDSLAPGEEQIPEAPSDQEVEEMAERLGSPAAEKDTLPLEGE